MQAGAQKLRIRGIKNGPKMEKIDRKTKSKNDEDKKSKKKQNLEPKSLPK